MCDAAGIGGGLRDVGGVAQKGLAASASACAYGCFENALLLGPPSERP
jgi:hypothetical protein